MNLQVAVPTITLSAALRKALFQPVVILMIVLVWMLSIDLHLANDGIEHLRLTLMNKGVFPVSEIIKG